MAVIVKSLGLAEVAIVKTTETAVEFLWLCMVMNSAEIELVCITSSNVRNSSPLSTSSRNEVRLGGVLSGV